MKRITTTLSAFVATLLIASIPVLADEGSMSTGSSGTMMEQGQKNECLLVSMNCGNQVDSIQQRIDRIQGELNRGSEVYTPEELKRLNNELEDANRTLEFITTNGGA